MLVLNTRPASRAQPLTAALQVAGHRVSELPLLDLKPLAVPASMHQQWRQAPGPDVVVVVSSLAAREGLRQLGKGASSSRQWLAVGESTASVLREAGLKVIVPSLETSEGLLALPALQQSRQVWLWRGLGGRELLAHTALERHQQLHVVNLYERHPHPHRHVCWARTVATAGFPDVVLLTSLLGWQLWREIEPDRWHQPILWTVGPRIWQAICAAGRPVRGGGLPDLHPQTVLQAIERATIEGMAP